MPAVYHFRKSFERIIDCSKVGRRNGFFIDTFDHGVEFGDVYGLRGQAFLQAESRLRAGDCRIEIRFKKQKNANAGSGDQRIKRDLDIKADFSGCDLHLVLKIFIIRQGIPRLTLGMKFRNDYSEISILPICIGRNPHGKVAIRLAG